jgi:hypothetical protein
MALYMIDVMNPLEMPKLDSEFKQDFKPKESLPGGELDLMSQVSKREFGDDLCLLHLAYSFSE